MKKKKFSDSALKATKCECSHGGMFDPCLACTFQCKNARAEFVISALATSHLGKGG